MAGDRSARLAVLRLAWPLASVMLGETLMGLVDTKLVGGLGASALGAVGLANAVLYFTSISVLGLMRGVKVCTAHAVGRNTPQHGRRYAWVGLAMGVGVGSLFALALMHADRFLLWLHLSGDLLALAGSYLQARAWGLPASCALAALLEHRQGVGEVRSSLWVGLGGNFLNLMLAYALIGGHYGLPAWGVAGAGWGTTITQWVQLVSMLGVLFLSGRGSPDADAVVPYLSYRTAAREVLSVGVPTALHFGFEYLAFASCTAILVGMGEVQVASHQIAIVVNRLAYLPGLAIGEVACILVSSALGAGSLADAERAVRASLVTAVGYMVGCGVLLAVFGGPLAATFSTDPEVVELTRRALLLAGGFQVMDAINIVMRGALRGARDVHMSALIGCVILWVCVPSFTYLLGRVLGWGVLGAWCSFVIETVLCAAAFSWRWHRGVWRQAFVDLSPTLVRSGT